MRGRKPVPTVLRKLHGNPRKTALPKHEPKPAGNLTDPPDWLSEDQKATWAYAIASAPPALLTRLDASVLTTWTVAADLHRQATIAQATVGLLVKIRTKATAASDGGGVPTASPYLNIITQQAKIIIKSASELGFTPVSRPRIEIGRPSPGPIFPAEAHPPADRGRRQPASLDEFLASAPVRDKLN